MQVDLTEAEVKFIKDAMYAYLRNAWDHSTYDYGQVLKSFETLNQKLTLPPRPQGGGEESWGSE